MQKIAKHPLGVPGTTIALKNNYIYLGKNILKAHVSHNIPIKNVITILNLLHINRTGDEILFGQRT